MQARLKKMDLAKELFLTHSHLFACPICSSSMGLSEPVTLRCSNHHTFDLARQGYINLLTSSVKVSNYDQDLFAARLALNQSGFFADLLAALRRGLVENAPPRPRQKLVILDAGCGEGSHLVHLIAETQATGQPTLGIGLDLAKEAIRLAASTYDNVIWCVADLARTPLHAASCDVILNIFSPANYAEFKRLLQPDGIVIKVFPGPDYLQEVRTALYAGSSKATYQNEDSVQQFEQKFVSLATQRVQYQQELTATTLQHLLRMTPLAWSADQAALNAIRQTGLKRVTVDTTIMIGRQMANLDTAMQ